MDLEHLEVNEQLDRRKLETLANLNPCLSEEENLLLSYYKRVRATWSNSAIKNLQRATGLKLTNKLNRCQFAIEAAKQELHFVAPEVARSARELETDQLLVTSYQIERALLHKKIEEDISLVQRENLDSNSFSLRFT